MITETEIDTVAAETKALISLLHHAGTYDGWSNLIAWAQQQTTPPTPPTPPTPHIETFLEWRARKTAEDDGLYSTPLNQAKHYEIFSRSLDVRQRISVSLSKVIPLKRCSRGHDISKTAEGMRNRTADGKQCQICHTMMARERRTRARATRKESV